MNIGLPEIIVVLVIALLVFGPKRLPQMARQMGRGIREFRDAAQNARTELGLDEVVDNVNQVKSDITSSLGVNELKAEISGVADDLGVSEIKAAVDDVKSRVDDLKPSLSLKSSLRPAQKAGADATVADPEPAGGSAPAVEAPEPDAGPVLPSPVDAAIEAGGPAGAEGS